MSKLNQIRCECDTVESCCVALNAEPIDEMRAGDLARGFNALGDPYRVAIMHLISTAGEPVCVVDVERHLPLSQSTVSYHLKVMLDAGLLTREKRTKWNYYGLVQDRMDYLSAAIDSYRAGLGASTRIA